MEASKDGIVRDSDKGKSSTSYEGDIKRNQSNGMSLNALLESTETNKSGSREDTQGQRAGPDRIHADPAVLELLIIMNRKLGKAEWPAKKKALRMKLSEFTPLYSTKVSSWLFKGTSKMSISKARDHVVKLVMEKLKTLGCFTVNNKTGNLVWHLEKISLLIESTKCNSNANRAVPNDQSQSMILEKPENSNADTGRILVIESLEDLTALTKRFPFHPTAERGCESVVAIGCEGSPNNLYLLQLATSAVCYVLDGVKLGEEVVARSLQLLLESSNIAKLFRNIRQDAPALAKFGNVSSFVCVLDAQLAMEAITGNTTSTLGEMLRYVGHSKAESVKKCTSHDRNIYSQRPLTPGMLKDAALPIQLLLEANENLVRGVGPQHRDAIQRASEKRASLAIETGGACQICFDPSKKYRVSSYELMMELNPQNIVGPTEILVSDDSDVLLRMLPEDICSMLEGQTAYISDIVLDKGRKPLAWINGNRVQLGGEDRIVSSDDISSIVQQIGGFGSDNRAGLEKQLHRISAIRNRQDEIIGLTLRVGRHVSGNASMIADLLFADCTKSILFLGEPGSGKTTVVREVTKQLAERSNVCIVDTSNEIAGDGDVPHPCVGYARRMMVPSLDQQSSVMIECVQNHTPDVMVIDEIGRPNEAEAARTCKQRGVRLIASAHGDLRMLIKNPKLRGLIGGVETVTLGDIEAKAEAKKLGNATAGLQKLKAQRAGPPTFDIIVELRRGKPHEWRIITEVGEAVDNVLQGQQFEAQKRIRNPASGYLSLEMEMA